MSLHLRVPKQKCFLFINYSSSLTVSVYSISSSWAQNTPTKIERKLLLAVHQCFLTLVGFFGFIWWSTCQYSDKIFLFYLFGGCISSTEQCSKSLYHSIQSWLVKTGIPGSWTILIPNILGNILPELIINQQGF